MGNDELRKKVELLSIAQKSFYRFTMDIFSKSMPGFVGGRYIEETCNYLSKYDRTMRIAFRSGFKSVSFYALVMYYIMFRGMNEDLDIRLFSYNEKMAGNHIQKIKALIRKNPFFDELIDLKSTAENILQVTWDRKHIITVRPHGIISFSRGLKASIILLDDILSDAANPLYPTTILKVNDVFKRVILESIKPGGEIHVVGSSLSMADFYFDPEIQKEFHTMFFPSIIKDNDGNETPQWPEFYTMEKLKGKISVMGEKAFSAEMQCVNKGTKMIIPSGIKLIENVKKGDKILGESGFTEVIKTFHRRTNEIVRIKANTQWLEITSEHPVKVVDTLKKKILASNKTYTIIPNGNFYKHKPDCKICYQWKNAGDIKKGDLVLFPLLKESNNIIKSFDISPYISVLCKPSKYFIKPIPNGKKWSRQKDKTKRYEKIKKKIIINKYSLRLFGHYISEGFSGYYPNTGSWKFGIASIHKKTRNIFEKEIRKTFNIPSHQTKNETTGTNMVVSNFFGNAFGHTAREKHFPNFIFSLSLKQFLIFFESMIEGDGNFEPKSQTVIYSSSSEHLMNQLFLILNSFGIKCTLSKNDSLDRMQLRISKNDNKKLLKYFLYNKKHITAVKGTFYPQVSFITPNYLLTRIRKVERKRGSFSVYNLHTKDDTYVANQTLVHNCTPYYSADSYFNKEQLRKDIVNPQLRNLKLTENFFTTNLVVAGYDVGKEKHPAAFQVYEVKNGKAIMIHHKEFRKIPYYTGKPYDPLHPSQVEYIKEAIKKFCIDKIYYDATRGELQGAQESGYLTPHFIPVIFNYKMKSQLATDFGKAVLNKQIEIFDDEDILNSICSVTNDLVSIETIMGHGDEFWTAAMALIGFNQFDASSKQNSQIGLGGKSLFDGKEKIPKGF